MAAAEEACITLTGLVERLVVHGSYMAEKPYIIIVILSKGADMTWYQENIYFFISTRKYMGTH